MYKAEYVEFNLGYDFECFVGNCLQRDLSPVFVRIELGEEQNRIYYNDVNNDDDEVVKQAILDYVEWSRCEKFTMKEITYIKYILKAKGLI